MSIGMNDRFARPEQKKNKEIYIQKVTKEAMFQEKKKAN